jgi:hypothetical protein
MEIICLMHEGSPYGYLKVGDKVILADNLARIVGATLPEVEGWIAELESANVFSRDGEGCIYSRRMVRDENTRKLRAEGGSKGGNPALKKPSKDNHKVETKVNLPPNLELTPSSSSSSSSSSSDIPIQSSGTVEKVEYQPDPHEGEFEQTLARWKGYGGTGLSMPEWTVFQKLLSNYPQGILIHGKVEPSALVASKAVVEAMTSGRNYGVANSASQYIKSIMERCVRDGVWPGEFAEKAPRKRIDPDANAAAAAKAW